MNKLSSQLSQVVWPKSIWHFISIDKLNIFGPAYSTERKIEHINLIIRDTHHQKEKEGVESARHSGKHGARRRERTPLGAPCPPQGFCGEDRAHLSRPPIFSLLAFSPPCVHSLFWQVFIGTAWQEACLCQHNSLFISTLSPLRTYACETHLFFSSVALLILSMVTTTSIHSGFPNDQEGMKRL